MQRLKKSMEELDRVSSIDFKKLPKKPFIIVLDNVRSAHNVGSIFRTCDAFLIEKIFLCGITPVPPHAEIHKTALGATEHVEWEYIAETETIIRKLKNEGYAIISIEQVHHSTPLSEVVLSYDEKAVFIFGHEVYGVEQKIIDLSDLCIEVPQRGTKHSLNVSVCAGIVLYNLVN